MSDGTQQSNRFPAALAAGGFRLDELRFEDLVAMSAGLGEALDFIGLDDNPEGHWGGLFDGDEALILARMLSHNRSVQGARLLEDFDATPSKPLVKEIGELARLFDTWLARLEVIDEPVAQAVSQFMSDMVKGHLQQELATVWPLFHALPDVPPPFLYSYATGEPRLEPPVPPVPPVPPAAPIPPGEPGASEASAQTPRFPALSIATRERLRGQFASITTAIARVQEFARGKLAGSLQSQMHDPAASMLIAFLQLFQSVQQRLNRFTRRHTDFYYLDLLQAKTKAAVPDSAHLVLARDPTSQLEVIVPQGAAFAAGKDAYGADVVFQADQRLEVGNARVAALCTLRLARDPLISPEYEFRYVTRAIASRLPVITSVPAGGLPYWPLFGNDEIRDQAHTDELAEFGLAIASRQLFLKEGQREIRVTLRFEEPMETDADVGSLIAEYCRRVDPPLTGKGSTQSFLKNLFRRYLVLDPTFRLGVSAPADKFAAVLAEDSAPQYAGLRDRSPSGHYRWFLPMLLAHAPNMELFRLRLGKLLKAWLLDEEDWLSAADLKKIRDAFAVLYRRQHAGAEPLVEQLDEGDPLSLIFAKGVPGQPAAFIAPNRDLIFDRLISRLFEVSATTASGWLAIPDAYSVRPKNTRSNQLRGLTLVVPLRHGDPALVGCLSDVHGADWQTAFPVLRLQLSAHARVYGYSVLGGTVLSDMEIAVEVNDVREVLVNNNLGRLDPSKPFQPFGPLPDLTSYLVVGSPEIARKNLSSLCLNLTWGGLPQDSAGFASYYRGYDSEFSNQSFTLGVSLLRDGQWKMLGNDAGAKAMFATDEDSERVARYRTLRVDDAAVSSQFRATDAAAEAIAFDLNTRNGFFKFQLTRPAAGFGHQEYTGLLSRTIAANARRKVPLELPNPPYTPMLEGLTLDYTASSLIRPGRTANVGANPEKIYHLHPFGVREIHPAPTIDPPTLLPRYEHDGNLYIGIEGGAAGDTISLLFHLRDEEAVTYRHSDAQLTWAYLSGNDWLLLPTRQILDDTTNGFLTSGIIRLQLPEDIDRRHTVMQDGLFWLSIATDRDFECFAALYGVHANAMRVTRVIAKHDPAENVQTSSPSAEVAPLLPAGTIKEAIASVAGLTSVRQVGISFGRRAAETDMQLYSRIGERLRHKHRAATAWDYERLVLEKFPEVFKAKCFANLVSTSLEDAVDRDAHPAPFRVSAGSVLIVVLPMLLNADAGAAIPSLNAVELKRIQQYLAAFNSSCAEVAVRNVAYERIQVRCTVDLMPGAAVGFSRQEIGRALEEYLSPWRPVGYDARFDWVIRREEVEAHIRALPFVRNVTRLSLLRIAEDDFGAYTLEDTARSRTAPSDSPVAAPVSGDEVRPSWPWSIAVPMGWHIIEIADPAGGVAASAAARSNAPLPTGIGHLRIGSSYIVGEGDD